MLRRIVAISLLFVIPATVWTADGAAQTREMKNPLEGQRKAIDQGEFVYKRPERQTSVAEGIFS